MNYHLIDDPLCDLNKEIPCCENCEDCDYFYDCMEMEEVMTAYETLEMTINTFHDAFQNMEIPRG